ncbi:MAG: endonuclease [Betaproteobacteria bacterium]|nr:endonuclease [Betaproteobacteria bacterium]
MTTKPLDRLMFAQGGLCYFCNMPLPKSEASVEHLVPSSRAGSNSDDNCVACCKAVNALFGSMSLKEKIRVVLNQNGKFVCPNGTGTIAAAKSAPTPKPVAASPTPKVDNYASVIADLKKRGASRPRKVDTLKNTIRAAVKNAKGSLTDAQLETLFKDLQVNGKVTVEGTKVSYTL